MKHFLRIFIVVFSLFAAWYGLIIFLHLPPYLLPTPASVLNVFLHQSDLILSQMAYTFLETVLGFFFGSVLGIMTALIMVLIRPMRYWVMPAMIVSQAVPTFVIAPLLVVWFGYGMASKILMAMLMLFFPVTSAFYDGLRATPPVFLDMSIVAETSRWRTLWLLQIPAALPSLATDLKVAATFAPMGAVIGEWVGSSKGLGYLMLTAGARMEMANVFAYLIAIIAMALILYWSVNAILKKLIFWIPG
jgi:putative hydroxymethylpyrimidine transport system permease protein